MKLLYKKSFTKSYQALDESRREKIKKAISLFLLDPFLPLLNNHVLHGKWQGYRSINVTGDLRIIFKELSDGQYELVELYDVGTHSQLY